MPRTPQKKKSVSIRDVAELAGVSLGSASRVINKVANVSDETRRKVERAIASLGYRPNHAAQTLRLRSSRTVGCLVTDVSHPLYAKIYRALETNLRPAGYMMLLANSLNQAEREKEILSTFAGRGMDGVVIGPGNELDAGVVAAVRELPVPVVLLDRDMDAPCDRVLYDHTPGVQRMVQYLAGLGHTRIAMVITPAINRPMRLRVEAFRRGHAAAGLALREDFILREPGPGRTVFAAVRELLRRPDRPTALAVIGTQVLSEALFAISALRLRIPQDVSVVALGDPDFAVGHTPAISALRIDLERSAAMASEMLIERMRGDTAPPRVLSLQSDLIERQSCAAPPKQA